MANANLPTLSRLGYSSMWTMELPCFGPSSTFYQELVLREYMGYVLNQEFNKRYLWSSLEYFSGLPRSLYLTTVSTIESFYWVSFIKRFRIFTDKASSIYVTVPVTTLNTDKLILTPRVHLGNDYVLINQYFAQYTGTREVIPKYTWLANSIMEVWSEFVDDGL